MASSLWYPGSTRLPKGNNGKYTGGPHKVVLHTTESRGWAHFKPGTHSQLEIGANPAAKKVYVRQFYPINMPGRALVDANDNRNHRTNRDGAIQIEIDGTCDPNHKDWGMWHVDNWPDWYYDGIRKVLDWVADSPGFDDIDRNKIADFDPYPKSISSVRFSYAEWESWNGICGHQHVPENHHGDPGNVDDSRLKSHFVLKKTTTTEELLKMDENTIIIIPKTHQSNSKFNPAKGTAPADEKVPLKTVLSRMYTWSHMAAFGDLRAKK